MLSFYPMYYFVDALIRDLERHVVAGKPERGGALLGLPNRRVVTDFLFDSKAQASAASFTTSRGLGERVRELEQRHGLQFKGIVHSHPAGLDRPSQQDRHQAGVSLELNSHLADYALPIVTLGDKLGVESHEFTLKGGKLSSYVARRGPNGEATISAVPCVEIPLARDLEAVSEAFDSVKSEVFVTRPGPELMLAGKVSFTDQTELVVLVTEQYPLTAPILLLDIKGETEQLQPSWWLAEPPEARLVAALRAVLPPTRPWTHGYGPWRSLKTCTSDASRGYDAGWPQGVGNPVAIERDERTKRQTTLAPLSTPHVFLVGAGSVGSVLAEILVRSGVSRLTVCDPDVVDAANLSRTSYEMQDVGSRKVLALRRLLLQIDPAIEINIVSQSLQQITADLPAYIADAQLLIAASDDPDAQQLLNAVAYAHGTPAVFAGLYAGADGGEVIFTTPERTACYLCAKAARHSLEEPDPDPAHDYGTGRLLAQVALAADIHHLTTAAAKIALGILAQDDSPASDFVEAAIGADITYLTMSMTPQFWFYPAIFGPVPSQYAYQSVWLAPSRQDDCPVCGSPEHRRPWRDLEPSLTELRNAAESLSDTDRQDSETNTTRESVSWLTKLRWRYRRRVRFGGSVQ
jgi:hypothetical protein